MTTIRRQAVQREEPPALRLREALEARGVREGERPTRLIAFEERLAWAGSHGHTTAPELLMELWDTTVLRRATCPHERDDIEATGRLGQGQPPLLLGPVRVRTLGASRGHAPAALEGQLEAVGQRRDRPVIVSGRPQGIAAAWPVPEL